MLWQEGLFLFFDYNQTDNYQLWPVASPLKAGKCLQEYLVYQ